MKQNKSRRVCFHNTPLHKRREPHPLVFLAERSSFWLATLSVVAFLMGNMVGRHGWYVFWRSVWGEGSAATIVYTGTVSPVAKVPDYVRWAREYGGDPHLHTFAQVPQDLLAPLPVYDPLVQAGHAEQSAIGQIYSIGYMGAYDTGGERDGSHPGVDIRLPVGTPVQAIANGVVSEVKEDAGFGTVVVIEHPNVPDPADPRHATTTLYSAYAHLSAALVEPGMVVQKGERIALSGQSGFASGPHLHFQIDRSDAPWHPYWPFTTSEARSAGYSTTDAVNAAFQQQRGLLYTVHPLLYVQAQYPATTVVASATAEDAKPSQTPAPTVQQPLTFAERVSRMRSLRSERVRQRLARRQFSQPIVVWTDRVVTASLDEPSPATDVAASNTVATISIAHDGSFSGRGWERVDITALDADGHIVAEPDLPQDLYFRTAYGSAEYRPTVLRTSDFVGGHATLNVLPQGQRTLVISVQPYDVLSEPMEYQR